MTLICLNLTGALKTGFSLSHFRRNTLYMICRRKNTFKGHLGASEKMYIFAIKAILENMPLVTWWILKLIHNKNNNVLPQNEACSVPGKIIYRIWPQIAASLSVWGHFWWPPEHCWKSIQIIPFAAFFFLKQGFFGWLESRRMAFRRISQTGITK